MAEITAAFHRAPQAAAQQLADVLPLDYRIETILHGKDFDNAYASRLFRVSEGWRLLHLKCLLYLTA
eukprot:1158774-Pelagomonas_calceolata.AAC.1